MNGTTSGGRHRAPPDPAGRARARRWLAVGLGLLVATAAIEPAARLGYRLAKGTRYPVGEVYGHMERLADAGRTPSARADEPLWRTESVVEVLHPYLGFVRHPDRNPRTNRYGFPGESDPLLPATPDEIVVAVLGGSFAVGFADVADAMLSSEMDLGGRRLRVVNLAMGGYKQPQQLLALALFLLQGAHFDAVVNIDGFNEVALPTANLVPAGVHPLYPLHWSARAAGLPDPDRMLVLAELASVRRARAAWARAALDLPLPPTVAVALVWRARDAGFARDVDRLGAALARDGGRRFSVRGPDDGWTGAGDLYSRLADVWAEGSVAIDALCRRHGIAYLHALQPNQYLDGRKPMTDAERSLAVDPDHPYRPGVVAGYPLLLERIPGLRERGVAVVDLTDVFAGIEAPVYVDDCCHVNDRGYLAVARALARELRRLLTETGPGGGAR